MIFLSACWPDSSYALNKYPQCIYVNNQMKANLGYVNNPYKHIVKSITLFFKFFNNGGCFICMNSFPYEQYTWARLNRRMVKSKLEHQSSEVTSTVSCNGAKLYTSSCCHYHIGKYGAKPHPPISCNYHTRKLLDAFMSLSNGFKSREI